MKYFTSDLHFFHKKVIEYCNRPWSNIEDMNEGLISNWNQIVTNDDEVYILGDFFFCGVAKAKEILFRLNGQKHLILGNHDWGLFRSHDRSKFGISSICNYDTISIGRTFMHMSHFPYRDEGDHTDGEERFTDHRLIDNGSWLMHGHVHTLWKTKKKMINVGVDVWDYKPVSEQQIQEVIFDYL